MRQALTQHPDARGLIVDIRENIGGMTLYGARVAELLIPGVFHVCQKRTRSMTGVALASASQLAGWSAKDIERDIASGLTTREEVARSRALLGNAHFDEYEDCFGAEGQAALYDGPCLLLTTRHTVSAAEDFAAMLRSNRRALILGTPTSGTTGTPLLQRLRCGGSMRVCSVAYRLLDGVTHYVYLSRTHIREEYRNYQAAAASRDQRFAMPMEYQRIFHKAGFSMFLAGHQIWIEKKFLEKISEKQGS